MKMRMKMKNMLAGLALVVAALSAGSCATRESAVNDLQNFSYELRDNSQYYTARKWKKAVKKFGRIRREIARHDYTVAERQRIGKLEGDCARYMVRGVKDGVTDQVLGIGSEIQGILDAIGIKQLPVRQCLLCSGPAAGRLAYGHSEMSIRPPGTAFPVVGNRCSSRRERYSQALGTSFSTVWCGRPLCPTAGLSVVSCQVLRSGTEACRPATLLIFSKLLLHFWFFLN